MSQRVILMSDIHGNLPALQSVINTLPSHDAVYVAGDHCLEGPDPCGVLDLLAECGWTLIMGNTDRDIVAMPENNGSKKAAQVAWTRKRLGQSRLSMLASLPFSARLEGGSDRVLVVHANPRTLDTHLYPTMAEADLEPYLHNIDASILAFGHLHTPFTRPVGGVLLVDVASVGHPKDRDHRAAYTVVEWSEGVRSVQQVRVPYDVQATVAALRESDMPGADHQIASLLKASY